MGNPRIPYGFTADRAPLRAPPGGRILVHVVINVEHWDFQQPMPRTIVTPPHGKESLPDVPNFGWVDYGMRCGLPRMLGALAARSLPASTSLNASVIEAYPRAAQALLDQGLEFIGHGVHQKTSLDAGTEQEVIALALDRLQDFTGQRPRGWLSPGLRESARTPELLRAAGIDYVCDWCVDDLPNWMHTDEGPLLAMPYNLELNDSVVHAIEKHRSDEMLLRLRQTLALFEREVRASGQPRVLALGLHPHLMGVPHRFLHFEEMLDLLVRSPEVCFMTGSQIAAWYGAQCSRDEAQASIPIHARRQPTPLPGHWPSK